MTTTPNNGIAVRGLRVLRSSEEGRVAWWSVLVSAVLADNFVLDNDWTVLTVMDGEGGQTLAQRRFKKGRRADAASANFVELVADMPQDVYESADWQQVLDEA